MGWVRARVGGRGGRGWCTGSLLDIPATGSVVSSVLFIETVRVARRLRVLWPRAPAPCPVWLPLRFGEMEMDDVLESIGF